MTERLDGDRVVVTGYSAGSHFPRKQAEINHNFVANGMSKDGPFAIVGSVYGRNLRFRGPGVVSGAVLGRGDISLLNHTNKMQRFLGGLHTSANIVAKGRGNRLEDSLAADIRRADHVIRGDVIGQNVSLENTIILGHVEAQTVNLTSCIVVGGIFARERLTAVASTVLHYHCPYIEFLGPCALVHASGESYHRPKLDKYTDGAGKEWDPEIRYYPMFRDEDNRSMSNRPWESLSPQYLESQLFLDSDWVNLHIRKKVPRFVDGEVKLEQAEVDRWILSLGGRVLNVERLEATIQTVFQMIKTGLEFEHYHPNDQAKVRRKWAHICTDDEVFLLEACTTTVEPRNEGSSN